MRLFSEWGRRTVEDFQFEPLAAGMQIAISGRHRFTTDSVLLAGFAAPRHHGDAVDLCCGCGAVLLLWMARRQGAPRRAVGVDIDAGAVALLGSSIAKNSLGDRAQALCADLRRPVAGLAPGSFDLAACNPPYFLADPRGGRQAQLRQETHITVGEVCAAAARLLRPGGRLCVSWRPARLPDLFAAMRQSRIEPKRLLPIARRPGEAPGLALVEGRLGGGAQLDLLAAAALENPDGSPSDFYRQMYCMR